jgi:hypothetical protein
VRGWGWWGGGRFGGWLHRRREQWWRERGRVDGCEALKVVVADGEGGASGHGAAVVGVKGGAASGSAASSGYTA